MAITAITRDQGINVSLVRLSSSDTLATVAGAGYLTAQLPNTTALNNGVFEWLSTDAVLVDASDGHGLFQFVNSNFTTLVGFPSGNGDVTLPVVANDFVMFDGSLGGLYDLGFSASDPSKTKVVMAGSAVQTGYLAHFVDTSGTVDDTAGAVINAGTIQSGLSGTAGGFIAYPATAANGFLELLAVNAGAAFNTIISNSVMGQTSTISIPDPGASTATFLLSAHAAGQSVAASTASATPGTIRALKGLITGSNATMTSGNLVGVRGEADVVGASGGFIYGVQGKVIPTGTLSGSSWTAGVFGQFDLSAATINAGQIAAVWGDMGASVGTFTDATGARMFAGTNTIASLTLNSMIYLYGKATNLFELSGSSSTYISTGAATPSGDLKKLAITIDGVTHYILAAAVWS